MTVQKAQPGPLHFSINGDGTAVKYGNGFWSIGLPDGREVMIHADRVEVVSGGALICWQDSTVTSRDYSEREPLETPELTLGFAPGQWTCFYAASVINGDPVAIDSLQKP